MLSPQTFESALSWYETGVSRIQGEAIGLGINYLERAIPVFVDLGDLRRATLARHYKLLALHLDERFDEGEGLFAQTMEGYAELGDSYGQALLLCHLAEAQASQGRWQRAHSLFNLATVIAENDQHRGIVVHALRRKGELCRTRDDFSHALALYQRAEKIVEHEDPPRQLADLRFLRAQALSVLGETGEAIALLEDVQAHLLRSQQDQRALEPLSLLRSLYEDEGQQEERNRIAQLMHLSSTRMIQADMLPRLKANLGPPIDRER